MATELHFDTTTLEFGAVITTTPAAGAVETNQWLQAGTGRYSNSKNLL